MNAWDHGKGTAQNLEEEKRKKKQSKLLVRGDEIEIKDNERRGNRSTLIIAPDKGFHIQTMDCRISELPGGRSTNVHRHRSEALIHFLQGRGYSMVDDRKIEWKAGDTIFMPSWVWHNFCNTDPVQFVRYIAITNRPLIHGLGVEDEEKKEE
jgi:gentisate 1,2-dioxygenase